ncbi:MAG TPA: aldehyde dehydrogenase family protein [Blastocatellia bacterium]|jgi:acyl-CoA reductase-like NAD-dependent aldehyde dehydrogenase|nr:aldehyde dehydrogenase family protein [Blastocatellia bacterium]
MLHIPLLRKGVPYKSLDVVRVPHHRTRECFVEISQANGGLIRRDLLDQRAGREALSRLSCAELIEMCARAANHFMNDSLPVGDAEQSPQDYVEQISATTGLPHVLARKNMRKIHSMLSQMGSVLNGLTRGLDLSVLDAGFAQTDAGALSFYPLAESLGVVLPSNSPGVHSLWIPAVPLKTPLVLKPGGAEPWTPYRIIQALVRAGCPREAFSYYPTNHAGAGEILRHCGRGMLFGDSTSTGKWAGDPRIELHGPGYSKVVIGADSIDEWEKYLDVMVASVVENGGRSCVNASGVWVPSRGGQIAEALAERLSKIIPRPAEDEQAQLAPFADPNVAARISQGIDQGLREPGARDVTTSYRGGGRLVSWQNCSYLLPSIIHCESPDQTLANREYLFPFASVVEVNQDEMPERLGPSLVVTAITSDDRLVRRLVTSPLVDRLNIGPIPTSQVSWDQPHEGNLFEHLYSRRAFQRAG